MTYGSMTVESSLFQNSVLVFPVVNNENHENPTPYMGVRHVTALQKIACMQCENASLNASMTLTRD
jgi:hypothetical protein